jgi:hypothetical protein
MHIYINIGTSEQDFNIEDKKKKLGKPNVFDSLQKRVPLLAFRTKEVMEDNGYVYPEKLLIVTQVWDYRSKTNGANSGSFYATTFNDFSGLYGDDVLFPGSVIKINDEGLGIIVYV